MNRGVDWSRVKQLFTQALDEPAEQREAWMERACAGEPAILAELRSLFAARAAPDRVGDGVAELLSPLLAEEEAAPQAGTQIGAYRLLRELGVGGMGRVYLAERADGQFAHQVALKLIRAELAAPELIQRFLRERDTLARLAHPNIAQLHDGGVSPDGSPYFTLEYVSGEQITTWCDDHHLDVRARVQLLLKVCDAVEHAHRNLIVHRDIKPSNILVTPEGEPKLLDFGIAKALMENPGAELTGTKVRPMTREYAAPEQVLGEPVTTATDVYTLGVLLYLLLSGRMPYRRAALGQSGWTKAILEEQPEPLDRAVARIVTPEPAVSDDGLAPHPSSAVEAGVLATARSTTPQALRRSLRGDLERIAQRAMAKAPNARYTTVAAFAQDLRAYLDGRAISGGTRTYRLRKFVRRYWLPLGAAGALLLVIVVGSLIVAADARQIAHEATTKLAVKDFLLGLFAAVDPHEAKGKNVTARELLDRGVQSIEHDHVLDPAQKAEINATLGRIYYQLGLFDQANTLQQTAIQAMVTDSTQTLLLAETEAERALTLIDMGDAKAAAALAADAMTKLDALPRASPADRARVLYVQATVAIELRDFSAAGRYADTELALMRGTTQPDPKLLFRALTQAGSASWGLKDIVKAASYFQEALAVASRDGGPQEFNAATAQSNLAIALRADSHFAEAAKLDEQALATYEHVLGPDHLKVMNVRRDMGLSYYHLGEYAKARAVFEKVLAAQRASLGSRHPSIAGTEINLGLVLTDIGDLPAAEQAQTEAIAIFREKFGHDYEGARLALGDLAAVHTLQGRLDLAESELVEIRNVQKKNDPGSSGDSSLLSRLGEIERLRGNTKAAVTLQREGLASAQKERGENSRFTALNHHMTGLALRDADDTPGAVRELRAALASFAGYLPNARHPLAATTRMELATLLAREPAKRAEAIALATEALSIRREFLGADDPLTHNSQTFLDDLQKAR
jgi:serine/threonine protein kinase